MTTWFTSDEHYGHKNIIKYCQRPFRDVDEMDAAMVMRHNSRVGHGDTVWHLGDFALDERRVQEVLPLLHGRHYLVAGNHDKCFKGRDRWEHWVNRYLTWGFTAVHQGRVLLIDPNPAHLCHFPTREDMDVDPRFGEQRPAPYRDWPMLCGHVHERWRRRGPNINVGVDQWGYAPVTLEELLNG